MRITWIAGNGFDLNLGLSTGYADFRERVYFSDSLASNYRNDLLSRLESSEYVASSDLCAIDLWCDLERLLGRVTELYAPDEFDLFSDTFEEMENLLVEYVRGQEARMPEQLPAACVEEFVDSIGRFDKRMVYRDRHSFDSENRQETISHHFISLNFTNALERFVDAAGQTEGNLFNHSVCGHVYRNTVEAPFHVHGRLEDSGNVDDVVFGVDSDAQIANEQFAQDARFRESWLKQSRNSDLYGNDSEQRLRSLIANADVICLYGCSMGETDGRIWRQVGERLLGNPNAKMVLFVYGLPDRHGPEHLRYLRERDLQKNKFQMSAGLEDAEMETLECRIFLLPSCDFFKFADKIDIASDSLYR